MFKHKFKRCVASLLLALVVSGYLFPLTSQGAAMAPELTVPDFSNPAANPQDIAQATMQQALSSLQSASTTLNPGGIMSSALGAFGDALSGVAQQLNGTKSKVKPTTPSTRPDDDNQYTQTESAKDTDYYGYKVIEGGIEDFGDHDEIFYENFVNDDNDAWGYKYDNTTDIAITNVGVNAPNWIDNDSDKILEFMSLLTSICDVLGPDKTFSPDAFDENDPFKQINEALTRCSISGLDFTETSMGFYLLMAYMTLDNPDTFSPMVEDIKNNLSPVNSYSGILTLEEIMALYNMTIEPEQKDYAVDDDNDIYNPDNLGILLHSIFDHEKNDDPDNNSAYLNKQHVEAMSKQALINCVIKYYELCASIQKAYQNDKLSNDEAKVNMSLAKKYAENFSDLLPYIRIIYEVVPEGAEKSVKELCDEEGVDTDATAFEGLTARNFHSTLHNETLFDRFYTMNTDVPIVAVDREKVLNDVNYEFVSDKELQEELLRQQEEETLLQDEDIFSAENILNSEFFTNNGYDSAMSALIGYAHSQAVLAMSDIISPDGEAIHANAVTISPYIQQGMAYSSTYIPMRTNVYDQTLIDKYDDDFKKNFLYKYGYNRKALYIDTSGTSATTYYNSRGEAIGQRKVATLRDLLECGDNEVTLFIDGGFYNSDEALASGNSIRNTRNGVLKNLSEALGTVVEAGQMLPWEGDNFLSRIGNWFSSLFITVETTSGEEVTWDEFYKKSTDSILRRYKYDLSYSKTEIGKIAEEAQKIDNGYNMSQACLLTDSILKANGYSTYDDTTEALVSSMEESEFRFIERNNDPDDSLTEDNKDTIVMPSSFIVEQMIGEISYKVTREDGNLITDISFSGYSKYSPLQGLAFVSLLYRSPEYYTLNTTVQENQPVFMASETLCSIESNDELGNQWYRNSLLNWMLLKNIRANVQIDYTYCIDLDCPVYMDIFGNILTESGIVVIPAAANATLHTAAFKEYNIASALYSVYGKLYSVPTTLYGAYSVLTPYFVPDKEAGYYIISPATIGINGKEVALDAVNLYDDSTKNAIQGIYVNNVRTSADTTRVNWMAMVNIINEVLRGAPINNINKAKENLYAGMYQSQGATVAAIKYEGLLDSLRGNIANSLIAIPNFATMDGVEYYVALLIKFMIVATTAVIIIFVYRDGVSGQFGIRTLWRSLSAIALTFICIVVTPAVFQLTYYAANKVVLEDECFNILLLNEEKRQTGMEVGMTSAVATDSESDEFMVQLDWISVPWYRELEHVLYGNTVQHVTETKLEAYGQSPVYSNSDVILQNDGVFISTSSLFDSVHIDFTYQPLSNGASGLFFWTDGSEQSAAFYMPYYVIMQSIVANINEYNMGRPGDIGNENYTNKIVSGGRTKTVGLSYNYFNSTAFMEDDLDICRLFQVYMDPDAELPQGAEDVEMDIRYLLDLYGNEIEFDPSTGEFEEDYVLPELTDEQQALRRTQPHFTIGQIQRQLAQAEKYAFSRTMLYNDDDREAFKHCLWYNTAAVHDFASRVRALDGYARDFVSSNHDLMTKVTDETFIKVLSLYLSIKYNQLFGIESANGLEIYNLTTEDLLRLCLLNDEEAALSVAMSFPRLVYNYGGEASVYLAAILSVILWVGSFIKPLCTVIVFVSVFLSIWVFRVLLRRPSANLFGYLITVTLLCLTNLVHALILKVSVWLPSTGLSILGCLIFMVVGQVAYLLVLAYVTGISLKDWSNLGYSEYEKEAMRAKAKFSNTAAIENLNGRIKHHEDNWDYYNDLVEQHRSRNA